ncbi:MAG: TonB-dependent receptor plug domain-containing protein [Bilophila wadsworthia]
MGILDGKVTIIPGARFDDNDAYGEEINPKLSLMYRPWQDTTFRASVGRSFKAPSPLQTHASPINMYNLYGVSNPDLKPEKSLTWQIGADQFLFDKKVRLSATYYDMQVDDMIVNVPADYTINGLPVTTYSNVDEARVRGIESAFDFFITDNWKLSSSYTYTSARNKTTGERLKDVPRHFVSASVNYDNPEWRFGASLFGTYTDSQFNTQYVPGMTPENGLLHIRRPFCLEGTWRRIQNKSGRVQYVQ